MAKFETSININCPIEEVFVYVTDLGNNAKWMTGVIKAELTSPGPVKAGSTYKFNLKTMGMKLETAGEVIAYDPPSKYTWKATTGPFPMSGSITFETVEGATRVTESIEAEPGGFFKLAEPHRSREAGGRLSEYIPATCPDT